MRYLYGDSSAFPLNENFVETAAAATDCAVALLELDDRIARATKTAEQAKATAARELADIDQLIERVDHALSRRGHLSEATAKVVEQVSSSARGQFDRARGGIKTWCEATIRKAHQGCGPSDLMAPVHRFMSRYQLPYTAWGLRWKSAPGEESAQAQVYGVMQRGLTVTLAVAIPPKHLWAQPLRVGQLEKDLSIRLVGKNWLGRETLREEPLDKLFITRVTRTSDKHSFVLSRRAKDPSPGLQLSVKHGELKRVTLQRVDENDEPIGEMVALESADALEVKKLWRRIDETIADLVVHRAQLLAATLYGKRITELESPSVVATAIIDSIAPLVRDMARHSRTPGELQLKRDLGDGRREELFISAAELVGKYARLTPRGRELFSAFGLEEPIVAASDIVPRRDRFASPETLLGAVALLPPPPALPSELVEREELPISVRPPAPRPLPAARPPGRPVAASSSIPPPKPPPRRSDDLSRSTSGDDYRLPPPAIPPRRNLRAG